MSGIEVIGLVLGAFPLAVSALEHYREACKTWSLLRNFETEWRKTLNDIKDEQVIFILNLKVLLLPLVDDDALDETDLEALLADQHSNKWNDTDLEKAFKERLGDAYVRFLEIAAELQHHIWQLLTVIGIDKPRLQARLRAAEGLPQVVPGKPKDRLMAAALKEVLKTGFEYRKEQLKFGLGRAQRGELLKEIRTNNKKLDRLLEKSDKVASYRKPTTVAVSPKAVRSLLQYWRHADRIYALIHRSWGCQCSQQHCAHLWLQHRSSSTFEFKLLVLWSPRSLQSDRHPSWQPQGLRITCLEGVAFPQTPLGPPASTSSLTPTVSMPLSACSVSGGKKRQRIAPSGVRFALSPPSTSALSSVRTSNLVQASSGTQAHLIHEISELCTAMGTCGMQASCIGALTDREKGSQYSVFSQPDQKVTAGEITLREVLRSAAKRKLRRSDRFRIALAVASSHLQLRSTPWARKQWESEDVCFPQTMSDEPEILFDRPYVAADFHIGNPSGPQTAKQSDRSFGCLGVMLMELLFGTSLDDHELWQQPNFTENAGRSLYRHMVAREWADSVQDEAGPDFSAAVMWCLNESPMTLDGDQWRRDLADRVVLPLQNCCDWIRAKPAD